MSAPRTRPGFVSVTQAVDDRIACRYLVEYAAGPDDTVSVRVSWRIVVGAYVGGRIRCEWTHVPRVALRAILAATEAPDA